MLALGTAVTTAVPPMVFPEPVSREPAVPVAYFFFNNNNNIKVEPLAKRKEGGAFFYYY